MTTATATDRVPCAPLAEAFLNSHLTAPQIAHRLGWSDSRRASTQIRRALGLKRSRNGCGQWRYRETMPRELAARFARALDVDPVEVGL